MQLLLTFILKSSKSNCDDAWLILVRLESFELSISKPLLRRVKGSRHLQMVELSISLWKYPGKMRDSENTRIQYIRFLGQTWREILDCSRKSGLVECIELKRSVNHAIDKIKMLKNRESLSRKDLLSIWLILNKTICKMSN